MYTIYLDLNDFERGALGMGTTNIFYGRLHIQCSNERSFQNGILSHVTTRVVMTASDNHGDLHGIRIPIEIASPFGPSDGKSVLNAAGTRLQQVESLLIERYSAMNINVFPGITLVSGMSADLEKYQGTQDLWAIEQQERDDSTRRLVWKQEAA